MRHYNSKEKNQTVVVLVGFKLFRCSSFWNRLQILNLYHIKDLNYFIIVKLIVEGEKGDE